MPAGVTWSQYIKFSAAALLAMITGSHTVHLYYKPLTDLNKYIDKELKHLPENVQDSIREELVEEGILH